MVVNSQVPNACRREDKIAVRRMFTKLQTYSYIQLFKRFKGKVLFQMLKHEVLIFVNSKATHVRNAWENDFSLVDLEFENC